jgi:hypothetical protein
MFLTPPSVRTAAVAEVRTSIMRWLGTFDPFGAYHRAR